MVALYSHPSWREDAASALGSAADEERAWGVFQQMDWVQHLQ